MGINRILFSFVIPTYNAALWLEETLESWTKQIVSAFEAVVVDDGSEDGTVDVAVAFKKRLNVHVIREKHICAPVHPRNIGIRASQGKMIVHCDADDPTVPEGPKFIQRAWDSAGTRDCLFSLIALRSICKVVFCEMAFSQTTPRCGAPSAYS